MVVQRRLLLAIIRRQIAYVHRKVGPQRVFSLSQHCPQRSGQRDLCRALL